MATIEQRLADALRALLAHVIAADVNATPAGGKGAIAYGRTEYQQVADARAALAAYDAWPERMATDYRVTTEWDAFDADSPRAAAVEVWQRIRESAGPVFTVRCSDGRILDVDLSDETDEGVEA